MSKDGSTSLAADRGGRSLQMGVWLAILAWGVLLRAPSFLHRMQDFDEGCHAAIATALLDGGLPYRDGADTKFPGVYLVYGAVFWLFGDYNMLAIHGLETLWTLATALILAWFARRLGFCKAAPWTALFYVSFTTIYPENLSANTEIFMNLPFAASMLALWSARSSRHAYGVILLAGVFAGLAMTFKQSAGLLLPVQALWVALSVLTGDITWPRAVRDLCLFVAGFCVPLGLIACSFWVHGCYDDFVYWTLISVSKYLDQGTDKLQFGVRFLTCFVPFALACGVIWWSSCRWLAGELLPIRTWLKNSPSAAGLRLITIWMAFSVAVTLAGKRMYPHYFLQYMPAMCLAAGMGTSVWIVAAAGRRWRNIALVGTLVPAGLASLWAWQCPDETRVPFTQVDTDYRPAVEYVNRTTRPSDRLFVWGWFTPLYVHTELKPGTRFVFTHIFVNYLPEYQTQDASYRWFSDTGATWTEIPEAWDMLEADFAAHPPELLLDTSPGNHHRFGHFPIRDFPRLSAIVDAKYDYETTVGGVGVYRLKTAAIGDSRGSAEERR